MYIARLGPGGDAEWARIGRVAFSKTGRTLYYAGRELRGMGQPWYRDEGTGETFHVQRAREDRLDRSEGQKRGSFPAENRRGRSRGVLDRRSAASRGERTSA